MSDRYKQVNVTCPICNSSKILDIPTALFLQKKVGAIKIQIPLGAVCPDHQCIMFIDSKGKIRGYEKIDLKYVMSTTETEREVEGAFTLKKLIQLLGTYCVYSIIHAKIFKYPIFIIIDEEFEYSSEILNDISNSILPESYRGENTLNLLKETDYDKLELNVKNCLLLDVHRQILQIPWNMKLKFEESLVEKALQLFNEHEQLFLLQEMISDFIKEAEYVLTILENVERISKKELIKQISKKVKKPKINIYRLNLIIEFINNRFSPEFIQKIGK